ncbi:nicotianamine synthase-like [Neltuma alba]|uniref:nicotianamine synthase-like n=1 Tax=Neltuma alba TaxID=207710 RepID=UPI0010A2DF1C|nr:nicotianamine synthase-like [Prosopis alba]XP_028791151.1 nicotianamine synthase-like [Prosopis alba]
MASFQNFNLGTQIPEDVLIAQIMQLHADISKLESLRPSKQVNSLFTHLVNLCTLPSSINIQSLPQDVKNMRESLINLCGQAEGLLELEFSSFLAQIPKPLNNLTLFPYYGNYVKLANLENKILRDNGLVHPKKVAFVGSGPMPLTSLIMATHHLASTKFDNFDIDEKANEAACRIVATDSELEKRMKFETKDIMQIKEKLVQYDCIFLAALVGMSREAKVKILGHLGEYMKEGGFLLVRSAKGARAFLYPVVEEQDLGNFEVLTIFHPTNDVINSVVLLRKPMV